MRCAATRTRSLLYFGVSKSKKDSKNSNSAILIVNFSTTNMYNLVTNKHAQFWFTKTNPTLNRFPFFRSLSCCFLFSYFPWLCLGSNQCWVSKSQPISYLQCIMSLSAGANADKGTNQHVDFLSKKAKAADQTFRMTYIETRHVNVNPHLVIHVSFRRDLIKQVEICPGVLGAEKGSV